MVIKVGINGFGRVGRIVFRTCFERPDLEVTAINDPAVEIEYICYLLKYDSTHGKFAGNVTHTDDEIHIDECRRIKVFHQRMPTAVPWNSAEVQYVVEASGMFTDKERASGHLHSSGVRRIIVTAPSADVPMIILGVNDHELTADQKIVSCGSSTLYCLAPIIKVLEDKYGVEEGFVTSIHAMTPSLKPLDGLCLRGKHWRDHRSILQNIVPAVTGACKALGRIIPSLKDKMCGLAFRVPIVNVSVLDLTVRLKEPTSIARIVEDIEEINRTTRHTIIKSVNEENVSSDFMKDTYSCILDVKSSQQLKPNSLKLICWYENEYSYACRVIDLIYFSESQAQCDRKNRATFVRTRYSKLIDVIAAIPETSMISKSSKISCNISSTKTQKIMSPRKRSPPLPRKPLSNDTAKATDPLNDSNDDKSNKLNDGNKNPLFYNSNSIFQASVPIKEAHDRLQKFKKQYREMVQVTDELLKRKIIAKSAKNTENDVNKINTNDSAILQQKSSLSCNSKGRDELRSKKINDIVPNEDNHNRTLRKSVSITSFDINNQSADKPDSVQTDSGIRSLTNSDVIKNKLDCLDTISIDTKIPSPGNNSIENGVGGNYSPGEIAIVKDKNMMERKMSMHFLKQCTTHKETQVTTSSYSVIVKDRDTDSHVNESMSIENKPASENDNEPSIDEVSDVDVKAIYKTTHNPVESFKNLTDIQNSSKKAPVSISSADESKSRRPAKSAHGSYSLVNHVLSSTVSPFYNSSQKKRNQDIFDKLDSTSESHSDDSFDVNGKKSQVLKITDLTNSLQDLDRLDKICRIIEISDELSDRLFSELDKEPNSRNKNTGKKWSFKDLCEKINFDDFCNKVFVKK